METLRPYPGMNNDSNGHHEPIDIDPRLDAILAQLRNPDQRDFVINQAAKLHIIVSQASLFKPNDSVEKRRLKELDIRYSTWRNLQSPERSNDQVARAVVVIYMMFTEAMSDYKHPKSVLNSV